MDKKTLSDLIDSGDLKEAAAHLPPRPKNISALELRLLGVFMDKLLNLATGPMVTIVTLLERMNDHFAQFADDPNPEWKQFSVDCRTELPPALEAARSIAKFADLIAKQDGTTLTERDARCMEKARTSGALDPILKELAKIACEIEAKTGRAIPADLKELMADMGVIESPMAAKAPTGVN